MADINRGTGNTYRMLLKAILVASDHSHYDVAIAVHSGDMAVHALHMVRAITAPLQDFVRVRWQNRLVQFNNGSDIQFYTPRAEFRGLRIHMVMVDEAWYSVRDFTDRDREWLRDLQASVQPYSIQAGLDPAPSA